MGLTPHFFWDAVAAFITLLPVPRVPGQLAAGLLLMQLQSGGNLKEKEWMILCGVFGEKKCKESCSGWHNAFTITKSYLMHVKRVDAHLSGGVLR